MLVGSKLISFANCLLVAFLFGCFFFGGGGGGGGEKRRRRGSAVGWFVLYLTTFQKPNSWRMEIQSQHNSKQPDI